jgi:CSLREA domain-containing protein
MLAEPENQFSFSRAALIPCRAQKQIPQKINSYSDLSSGSNESMAMRTQNLNGLSSAAMAIVGLLILARPDPAWGAIIEVTNTTDSGACSLREAILSANLSANVPDAINFNITGAGPHTISPLTPLPAITDPLVIDGYTQPGASLNTLATGEAQDGKIPALASSNQPAVTLGAASGGLRPTWSVAESSRFAPHAPVWPYHCGGRGNAGTASHRGGPGALVERARK